MKFKWCKNGKVNEMIPQQRFIKRIEIDESKELWNDPFDFRITKVVDFNEMTDEIDQETFRTRISRDEIEMGEEGRMLTVKIATWNDKII